MAIPFVDLGAQYQTIKNEMDKAIQGCIQNTAFIGGSEVAQFGENFAATMGTEFCIPCANGTDAIYIVLKMLGIGSGDEVITVANSWISTSETITQTGARPVFVDIDDYFTIDVKQIESKITSATKAIIPVHLYGQMSDMPRILELAKQHNLYVIEDTAQAHLATLHGRVAGTAGDAGTFSFYPGKNLGAYGDAGGIITNNAELAEKCKMYANHGALIKHQHQIEGINSRLDGLQAAVLNVKLPHLKAWTAARQRVAARYDVGLTGLNEVMTPKLRDGATHSYHLYVIRAQRRDELMAHLKEKAIGCALHYPTPLPLLPAYSYLKHTESDFPKTVSACSEILSLPIFPEMTETQQDYVIEAIRGFYA